MQPARPMRLILAALVAVAAALCPLAAAQTTCSLQLGNAPAITFDRCLTIDGIGDNFVVYWTQNASNTVWGLSTASSSGYVSVGAAGLLWGQAGTRLCFHLYLLACLLACFE